MKEIKEVNPDSRWTKMALLESERRYRRLLDNSPDIIFRMSLPDRKFEYVSPAAEQITGYPPEDYYSHGGLLEKLIHPEWQEYFKKEWKALLKGKILPYYEYQIIDRAGKTRWLRQTNMLVADEAGHTVAVEGIITDITGRRQAEAALQKSEEQYRNLVETTGTGYVILDKEGRIITANQEYVRLTGRAGLEEIQGKPVTDWTTPYDLERNSHEIEQCFRNGTVRGLEIDYLKPDGSIQPVEMNASVIKSDTGHIILMLCRDITERRRVEDALKDEQAFTCLLLDASPAYFVAIGADGRTIMMNKALTDVLEYKPEKIQGADYLTTFVPEAERERVAGVFHEIAFDGKITVNENWITSKSGKSHLVEWHGRPVKQKAGKPDFFVGVGIDITRRRQMEEALKETEQKLSLVMDGVPALLAYINANMRFVYVNKAYADWYGSKREDIIGKHVRDLHDDVFERAIPNYQGVLQGTTVVFENRTVDAGGKEHFVSVRLIPDFRDNRVAGWFAAVMDITERRRMEEELRESECRFRTIFNSTFEFMALLQPDGLIQGVNATALEFGGLALREVLNKPFWDGPWWTLSPEIQVRLKEAITRVAAGEFVRYEEDVLGNNNQVISIDLSLKPVRSISGAITSILAEGRDISERRRATEALGQSEKRLRRFIESGLFGVIFWNTDGRITDANDKFLEMLGYTREDLEAGLLNGFTLTPPEYAYIDEYSMAELQDDGVNKSAFEKEYFRKDGTRIPVILAGAMLDEKRFEGVAFVLDITQRKEAEAALRQSNRQLKLLSGITRHDIMNKITTILGYLSLVEMELKNPEVKDYLLNIESATRAIRSQIEFTKIYENLGTHEPQWQDLYIIIALSSQLPSKIRLSADVKGIEVYADPMIERVFFNLLDNSVRHGGHMTKINVSSHISDDTLTIVWEDNGVGIPVDEKEKIFERGFGKNTGLGLFLVREVLLLTGITIKETGEPGKGARFEIAVPKGMYR
jgi:PAS domain S-box-containing protein